MKETLRWPGTIMAILAILGAVVHGFTDTVEAGQLVYSVDPPLHIPLFETRFLYFGLILFSFLSVFILSFDQRVAFSKKWKYLWPGLPIIAAPFVAWDVWFTAMEVWGFNPDYYIGIKIMGLPPEEWLFFAVIPFACVFVYENVLVKVKSRVHEWFEQFVSPLLILAAFVLGILAWGRSYSAITYLLTGGVFLLHYLWGRDRFRADFLLAFAWCFIPFLLIDGALTGIATLEPIVVYNPDEFMGWRIWTVPVDDAVYGFLLLLGNMWWYERRRQRATGVR